MDSSLFRCGNLPCGSRGARSIDKFGVLKDGTRKQPLHLLQRESRGCCIPSSPANMLHRKAVACVTQPLAIGDEPLKTSDEFAISQLIIVSWLRMPLLTGLADISTLAFSTVERPVYIDLWRLLASPIFCFIGI
jgi:hypothetical protein